MNEFSKFTVPKLAKLWGVSPNKILTWIKSGELRAVNMAANPTGRPRFAIDVAAIQAFEEARVARPAVAAPQKSQSRVNMKIESFI